MLTASTATRRGPTPTHRAPTRRARLPQRRHPRGLTPQRFGAFDTTILRDRPGIAYGSDRASPRYALLDSYRDALRLTRRHAARRGAKTRRRTALATRLAAENAGARRSRIRRGSGRRRLMPAVAAPRFRLTAPEPLEIDIHAGCADALDKLLMPPAFWFTYPAGVQLSAQQAARYSRLGLKRGLPDIFVLHDGAWGIELKRRGGTLSKTRIVRTRRGSPRILAGQEEVFPLLLAAGVTHRCLPFCGSNACHACTAGANPAAEFPRYDRRRNRLPVRPDPGARRVARRRTHRGRSKRSAMPCMDVIDVSCRRAKWSARHERRCRQTRRPIGSSWNGSTCTHTRCRDRAPRLTGPE